MRHVASPAFWQAYAKLPDAIRALADKKKAGRFWSACVGLRPALSLWKRWRSGLVL